MTDEQTTTHEVPPGQPAPQPVTQKDYEEFEIGEHQVPWFLWVFFTFIILWASISWIPFVNSGGSKGY